MPQKLCHTIKLSELENELRKVHKLGYGHTIELKINGEYYTIIKD